MLRCQLCDLELRTGAWDTAERILDGFSAADEEVVISPNYEYSRALLAAGRGDTAEAERWAAETISRARAASVRWDEFEACRARGIAALLLGEPERAVNELQPVWEHTRREGVDDPGAFPVAPDLVEALVELGATEEARAVSDWLDRLAEDQDHPWGRATAKRCAAMIRLASSYDEGAAAALEECAAEYQALGLRFDRARCLLLLGRTQRRYKKRSAARRTLEEAASAFDDIGSPGWGERTRAELARLGTQPARSGELTPTEQRVVELAAGGLSNKEIARRLFVTVHTVEVHLAHAYAKLGVRSRAQLAARMAGGR
jgi:DNA-binding CsgD family transcriptional regulator